MTMKFRVEWLLVSILITAAAWSGVAGAVSPAAEKAILGGRPLPPEKIFSEDGHDAHSFSK